MKLQFETPKKYDRFLKALAKEYSNGNVNKFAKHEFNKVIHVLKEGRQAGFV